MHIHILQVTRPQGLRSNKDTNSGYGTVNNFGQGVVARLLTYFKNKTMNFPEIIPAYLNAILTNQNHKVTFGQNQTNPDAQIVIIPTSIIYFHAELSCAEQIKQVSPHIRVGFLGAFASVNPELYANIGDFVVRGEPENALLAGKIEDFHGIVEGGFIENLDTLPFPNWTYIQAWKEKYGFVRSKRGRFLPVLSSRGCPMPCRYYCTYPLVQGKDFRSRSARNVVDELVYLQDTYQMTTVLFRDPLFSLDQMRVKEICELILERGMKLSWICETHPRLLTPDLVSLMSKAGCVAIKFGIESGNKKVMRKSHRTSVDLDNQEKIVRCCEDNGIDVLCFYILGYFDDTRETILQTIKYAQKLNTFGAQFTVATPYPGTQWYEDLIAQPAKYSLDENFERYTQYQLVYNHPNISCADMERLKSLAYHRYYLRLAYLTKHLRNIL